MINKSKESTIITKLRSQTTQIYSLLYQDLSSLFISTMSNPYEFFAASDDEDSKPTLVKTDNKPKRTHQEKRLFKQQQDQNGKKTTEARGPVTTEPLPEKVKESHKYPHMERPKKEWKKELGEGHYLDRRSGTGREDRPRKAGGGYGNVGNAKDLQQPEKYVKEEETTPQQVAQPEEGSVEVEPKQVEPEKLTLEEYYKAKGVDLTYNAQSKAPSKKSEVNAEWIKKQKLTLIATKEDLKNQERNNAQTVKHTSAKLGLGIDESDFDKVGFGQKGAPKEAQRTEEPQKRGKKAKPQFTADDFPSL